MISTKKVAIIYPYTPHYRSAVFRELVEYREPIEFDVISGQNTIDKSIRTNTLNADIDHAPLNNLTIGIITIQFGLLGRILKNDYHSLVFLGNPYIITTWLYALIARILGIRVFFWTHGWLSADNSLKTVIRNVFYRLANGLLLYGDRAKDIGINHGFRPDSLFPIYNSLDYELQQRTRQQLIDSNGSPEDVLPTAIANSIYFACVARLTAACQFDVAIEALALLKKAHTKIPLVLIGTGPEADKLRALANDRQVEVFFLGEQYSEDLIGNVLFNSRAVVSPGKVGLTAMHSLAYGTPVITHGDFSTQMPEYEAITPGKTGDFFKKGDPQDLANTLLRWHNKPRTQEEREACIQVIEEKYNPRTQARLIRDAITKY